MIHDCNNIENFDLLDMLLSKIESGVIETAVASSVSQAINFLDYVGVTGPSAKIFVLWALRSPKGIQLGD